MSPQIQQPALNLKDIHLAEEITAWPPAIGWWLAVIIISILLISLGIYSWKRYRFSQSKRLALLALNQVEPTTADAFSQINIILKQSCLAYFPREQVAGLYGQSWQQFLEIRQPKNSAFDQAWLDACYDQQKQAQQASLFLLYSKNWIKQSLPPKSKERRQHA